MVTLAWPWMGLLLLLPVLMRLLPAKQQNTAPVYLPTLPHLSLQGPYHRYGPLALAYCSWLLLVLALTRPVWLSEPIPLERPHRDLLMAVDLSDSMRITDMLDHGRQISRLDAVKQQLNQFIAHRAGDRLGLILFADHAYLMAPLTSDWQTLQSFVDELDFSMAGYLTSIGEAIGLGIKRLNDEGSRQKIMILLSDGRDTVGTLSPIEAAQLAAKAKMRIYTIGLGAENTPQSQDPDDDLDEDTLQKIASLTGGQYYRARDPASLSRIYTEIDSLEPMEKSQKYYQPRQELYPWPLALALSLGLILSIQLRRQHD